MTATDWLVLLEIMRSVILLIVLCFLVKLMFQASYDRRQRELEVDDLKQAAAALSDRTDSLIQYNTYLTKTAVEASAATVEGVQTVNEKITEIATGMHDDKRRDT